jgi:hypothetical protein
MGVSSGFGFFTVSGRIRDKAKIQTAEIPRLRTLLRFLYLFIHCHCAPRESRFLLIASKPVSLARWFERACIVEFDAIGSETAKKWIRSDIRSIC